MKMIMAFVETKLNDPSTDNNNNNNNNNVVLIRHCGG